MPELIEPKKVSDSAAVIKECDEIEADIAALRASYEQYFLGIEKRPPLDQHKALTKRMQKIRNTWTRQTAAKFRVQSTAQKFATYERMWAKTMQEIENGIYVRDLKRLKRKQGDSPADAKRKKKDATDELVIDDVAPEELLEGGESMEDALAKASAAAVASVSAPKIAPVAPSVAPVAPPIAPAIAPMITPVAPVAPAAAAQRPATGSSPAVAAPGSAPRIAPLTPAIPGITPVVPPAAAAKSSPGLPSVRPVSPPVAGAPRTPSNATTLPGGAARPAGSQAPTTGSRPPAAAASSAGAAPRAAASSAPPSSGGAQLSDDKLKAVYDAFVKAKKRCNEDTSSMSYEQVATSLRKQVPELMKQHNAKAVEFKVVIKDGKAVLRAVPKDG